MVSDTPYPSSDHSSRTGSTSSASNDADYAFTTHHSLRNDASSHTENDSALSNVTGQSGYKKAKQPIDYQADQMTLDTDDYYQQLKAELNHEPLLSSSAAHDAEPVQSGAVPRESRQNGATKTAAINKNDNNAAADTMPQGHKTLTEKQLTQTLPETHDIADSNIPERVFMNSLIKHTGIALAIIIPLAAFSAYAAPQAMPATQSKAASDLQTAAASIEPSDILYKSAATPTTVDKVDLTKYAGTWYEIGRLPMYFQRKCARDVTATYTPKADGSGITVLNKCTGEDGGVISAEGIAKPADDTGSKLKVTFLPSWIRWLPVGRADYWILARDDSYQTALVGSPDKEYLWLLARTPNISQQTYTKYRQIAQQQGYDLKEFQLTTQSQQTVNLVP